MAGLRSISVSGNQGEDERTMAMLNPCHPGETLRDDLAVAGLTVTEAAARLGCTRQALSRLLNGKAGISPAMAIAQERMG